MTEGEWLACDDPKPMLRLVKAMPCDRKLRLFAAACVRRAGPRLTPERLRVVEATERLADGHCTPRELVLACRDARTGHVPDDAAVGWHFDNADLCLLGLLDEPPESCPGAAALLRELFGPLPFRPVRIDPDWLAWQGGTVVRLARSIHDEGRFEDLPVMADALEEAGSADADLLGHCRSGGEHVRGCWAVDCLLGHRTGAARVEMAGRSIDEVVADCVAAGTALLSDTGGRLAELLGHRGVSGVGRLEVYDFRSMEDWRFLECRGHLGPVKAVGLHDDGQTAERLIPLLAGLPDAGGLETLYLYWDTYLESNVAAILKREEEVNRLVGKDVCLVDPYW